MTAAVLFYIYSGEISMEKTTIDAHSFLCLLFNMTAINTYKTIT